MKHGRRTKRKKLAMIFILLLLLLAVFVLGYFVVQNRKEKPKEQENLPVIQEEEKKLTIIDEASKERSYAVMINNHSIARRNHAGLDDAYIVYEGIVEGGLTRLMAIFKDKQVARIGSVRSARHDFLDYALENDAIYIHFGWSPQAESDIRTLGINNINGLYDNAFWRDYSLGVALEHTAFTSMENLKSLASKKGYRSTTTKKQVLNYTTDEVNINDKEGSMIANQITLPYSYAVQTSYTYDSAKKVYLRFVNGEAHMNLNHDNSKTQIEVKNIIVATMNNYSLDSYGRQEIENVGTGSGYYITNGYAIPITWEKSSRQDQTIYRYLDGTEIKVNDGNTYIQLFPTSQTITISE